MQPGTARRTAHSRFSPTLAGMTAIDPAPWRGLQLVERVAGGHRNEVWRGDLDGRPVSVRRSRRSAASLAWELDVIGRVGAAGVGVADVVATDDGERSHDGVVVQHWIDGRPPTTDRHWHVVAETLRRVHAVPVGQRPEAVVVTELTEHSVSVDADVGALPPDVRRRVLEVFATFADAPVSLIHGDPNPSNIVVTDADRIVLLDWDESRVDVSWHDLSNLGVQVLDDETHARAGRLSHAWEAVNAWTTEPDYARSRLARLHGGVA